MNIDGSISLNTGESTSWTVVDESVKLDTGEGTKEVYGVEVSPGKVNSESTTSTDKGESVLEGNRFMGVFMDDPYNGFQANSEWEGATHLVSFQRTSG